jgi:hypothetical protein
MNSNAQLFGRKDIGIRQGIINFHPDILNNSNNNNSKTSWVTEFDRHFVLTRMSSLNYGLGLGNYRNQDNRFETYENSNFFRVKFGLVLHLPQPYSSTNWSPKRFNPYLIAAYNMDILDYKYGVSNGSRLSSSIKFGGGLVYRLSHELGISYEFSHNSRVTEDYRTSFQHLFGIIINLDKAYTAY